MPLWLAGACVAVLLVFSTQAMQAAQTALHVFVGGVLPALFPMTVLSRLLPVRKKDERFAKNDALCTALFAFAAGSPAAAQRVSTSHTAQEWLYALTGVMSPMFFTGTLAGWTGNADAARRMLVLHWAGAALTALIWKCLIPQQSLQTQPSADQRIALPSAIGGAAQSMLGICGAMMLFSVAAGVLRAVMERLFPLWTAQNAVLLSVAWAVLEIGGGAHAVLQAFASPPYALLSALCAFGGLSIWMQNLLFCAQSIRPAKLLGMRMLHGALCYGLGLLIFP
ncbi:MAG: hypothetical protein IKJ26_10995 [Clostridia bacterium]|nr:hypothetical protein [Clostridia bacterium]